jgi:hypothetical protein
MPTAIATSLDVRPRETEGVQHLAYEPAGAVSQELVRHPQRRDAERQHEQIAREPTA